MIRFMVRFSVLARHARDSCDAQQSALGCAHAAPQCRQRLLTGMLRVRVIAMNAEREATSARVARATTACSACARLMMATNATCRATKRTLFDDVSRFGIAMSARRGATDGPQ
jgi:hypothetical protein